MFDYSVQEKQDIDAALEPKLAWAADRKVETQQLALDATRLMSCTEERFETVKGHGFIKRCWFTLAGKRTELQHATQQDLLEMQKIAWRYIGLLQERDLMLAHSMITVRNNLLTLQADNQEVRSQLKAMATAIYDRFLALEERMKKLEAASAIHGWLLTLDTHDYPDRYTPMFRMLAVIRDFRSHKAGDWNFQELRYLQQAIKQVELPWKEPITVNKLLDSLADEISAKALPQYQSLIRVESNGSSVPYGFISDSIAAPAYQAIHDIAHRYESTWDTIEFLADNLDISTDQAIKHALLNFVKKQGIDVEVALPLRDMAIEFLHCMDLAQALFQEDNQVPQPEQAETPSGHHAPSKKPQSQSAPSLPAESSVDWEQAELSPLRDAAEGGDPCAQAEMGRRYFLGIDLAENNAQAVRWLQMAADAENGKALHFLAQCYLGGYGVDEDATKGKQFLKKASESGYHLSKVTLASVLLGEGTWGTKEEAKKLLSDAEAAGAKEAYYHLGKLAESEGDAEDAQHKAYAYYMKGAELGDSSAAVEVGLHHYLGIVVAEDNAKAVKHFQAAADQGDADGLYWLGMCHKCGHGVSKELVKAYELLGLSAEAGHQAALYEMGLRAWLSDCKEKAHEPLQMAADKGHREARYMVGRCMERGAGTELDETAANQIFRVLASGDDLAALLATISLEMEKHCDSEMILWSLFPLEVGDEGHDESKLLSFSDSKIVTLQFKILHLCLDRIVFNDDGDEQEIAIDEVKSIGREVEEGFFSDTNWLTINGIQTIRMGSARFDKALQKILEKLTLFKQRG